MKNRSFLAFVVLAALPAAALARPAALQMSLGEQHVAFAGAAANLPGATFSIRGVSRRLGRAGVRVHVSYARGAGAELDEGGFRFTAYPAHVISPYAAVGVLSLTGLSGATSVSTSYAINPYTGAINPVVTTAALPPVSVATGYAFAGLHARYYLSPRLVLTAHAALGAGFGGSVSGVAASASGGQNPLATSLGIAMRYRVTRRLDASLGYSRVSIPARGSDFKSSGVSGDLSYRF